MPAKCIHTHVHLPVLEEAAPLVKSYLVGTPYLTKEPLLPSRHIAKNLQCLRKSLEGSPKVLLDKSCPIPYRSQSRGTDISHPID